MADNVIVRVPEQQFIRGEDGYSPEVTIENIDHGHSVTITDRDHPDGQSFNVVDGDSAYEQAVAGGYTGTEEQFNAELAAFKDLSDETKEAAPFYAEYGVTTKAEIQAALNGKRQIYLHHGNLGGIVAPYTGTFLYADIWGEGTGYGFALTNGNFQYVYELKSEWTYSIYDLTAPAQRAEEAADQALIRMNSADASAQAAATTATTFTEQTVPAAVNTINEAKADALTAVGNAQTTAVGAVQQESTTQQAAIQQKGEDTIASIPSDYTTLSEDVDDLKSAVDQKAPAIYDTASGAIASFEDGADGMPLKGLTVDIEPVQAGEGDPSPENVRSITGWTGCDMARTGKNLANFVDGKAVNSYGGVVDGANRIATVDPVRIDPTKTYKVVCAGDNSVKLIYAVWNGNTLVRRLSNVSLSASIDTSGGTHFYVCCYKTDPVTVDGVKPMIVFADETDLTYEPYTGNTYNITFPTEAGTVYGGTLDVVNKKLTVDRAAVDMGSLSWEISTDMFQTKKAPIGAVTGTSMPLICSCYPYNSGDKKIIQTSSNIRVMDSTYSSADDFKAAMAGQTMVFYLATPIVYDLTTDEITTLLGTNNIWSDAGPVEVDYPADTKLYVDQKIAAAIAAALNA